MLDTSSKSATEIVLRFRPVHQRVVAVPYPNRSAILTQSSPNTTGFSTQFFDKFKWARRDLNPRPSGPEPDALSTELRALDFFEYNTSCGKWRVPIANFLTWLQTAWPMRVQLARAIVYQAVLEARDCKFYVNCQKNTTIGKIIGFNIAKIRFTFDRSLASTVGNMACSNSLWLVGSKWRCC